MQYLDENSIVHEFAERTLKIWEQDHDEEYDVTLTINLMLGLVVVPQQAYYRRIDKFFTDAQLLEEMKNACTLMREPFTAEYIMRKIRNSVCHGRMKIKSAKSTYVGQPSQIKSIHFTDIYHGNINFEMEVSVDLLKRFVKAFAEAVINRGEQGTSSQNKA